MQQWVGTSKGIYSIYILFQAFLSSEFTCLCILLNILQFFWKPFVELMAWCTLKWWMCLTQRDILELPALTVFPDCIQSIAVVWRTVRETERGRERGWCTTTPLTASQWDSTWELPSVPCAWILYTLVAKLLPVWVSYRCVRKGSPEPTSILALCKLNNNKMVVYILICCPINKNTI